MDDAEEGVGDGGAHGAQVAEGRGPADAHEEDRQHRGEGAEEQGRPGKGGEVLALDAELDADQVEERGIGLLAPEEGEGLEEVEREAGEGEEAGTDEEAGLEEGDALGPDDRDEEERAEADHAPVIGRSGGGEEGEGGEKAVLLEDAVAEEAEDGEREQEEVDHFAGHGGGVLPEGELDAEQGAGGDRGNPGRGNGQKAEVAAFALALIPRAIMGKEGDRLGEQPEHQRAHQGGEGVQTDRLETGWQPADGEGDQQGDRTQLHAVPVPAGDLGNNVHSG